MTNQTKEIATLRSQVFVVTSGAYSDYHIEAIFSSQEKAEAFKGNSPDGTYDIKTLSCLWSGVDDNPAFERQYV